MLRAQGSASCDIIHETGGQICSGHWNLPLVSAQTRQGIDLLLALGSASYDIIQQLGGAICYGHWVLSLVRSHTRQGVWFVTGIEFCVLCYPTRDRRYDLLYGHWILYLLIPHTRQRLRFVTGIGFCILRYHTRNNGGDWLRALGSASCDIRHDTKGIYDLLRALGSVSCDISHETGATICYGQWVLRPVLSPTRQKVRFVTGSGFCVL